MGRKEIRISEEKGNSISKILSNTKKGRKEGKQGVWVRKVKVLRDGKEERREMLENESCV